MSWKVLPRRGCQQQRVLLPRAAGAGGTDFSQPCPAKGAFPTGTDRHSRACDTNAFAELHSDPVAQPALLAAVPLLSVSLPCSIHGLPSKRQETDFSASPLPVASHAQTTNRLTKRKMTSFFLQSAPGGCLLFLLHPTLFYSLFHHIEPHSS